MSALHCWKEVRALSAALRLDFELRMHLLQAALRSFEVRLWMCNFLIINSNRETPSQMSIMTCSLVPRFWFMMHVFSFSQPWLLSLNSLPWAQHSLLVHPWRDWWIRARGLSRPLTSATWTFGLCICTHAWSRGGDAWPSLHQLWAMCLGFTRKLCTRY